MMSGTELSDGLLTVVTRGRFTVLCPENRDLTPSNRKERAVIALLALSQNGRASRQWLQSKLWSESEPQKAAGSLRRALANIRSRFADCGALIEANKHEMWLSDAVRVDNKPALAGKENLLELVNAPDPAFEEWLRDQRAADMAEAAAPPGAFKVQPSSDPASRTMVVIRSLGNQTEDAGKFFETVLLDTLSMRFEAEGVEEIYTLSEPDPEQMARATTVIHIELLSINEDGYWSVHLRALADQDRRFLWSGRLRLDRDARHLSAGAELQGFVTRAITQILLRYRSFRSAAKSPLMIMGRAAARLYDPNSERVRAAENDLAGLVDGEGTAVALAWQGFAKLARLLEFGDVAAAEEAQSLVHEAMSLRPGNALITALAARVAMDVTGDFDRARALAADAMLSDDGNPYALQAAARISLLQGRVDDAQILASRARQAAEGMAHVFAWDFELCLTALARGDFAAARDSVNQAHRNNPQHRASLRYLIATNLLMQDYQAAEQAIAKLVGLEPGFELSDFQSRDYPVLTLRNLGLTGMLQGA